MAQSGYTPILIYASGTATNVPLAANLTSSASGAELALNYADGKLYYKDSGGVVQVLASKAGNVNVSSFSAGTTGFTPNTATTGAVTLSGTLATTNGGTGLTSFTANGVVYASSTSALTTGTALTFDGSFYLGLTGAMKINSNGYKLRFYDATGATGYGYIYTDGTNLQFDSGNTQPLSFLINGSEGMRLTSTGLGIGTSSPSTRLSVSGVSTFTASVGSTSVNAFGATPSVAGGQGIVQIISTDAAAVDAGGVLTFSANTTSSANYAMAAIAGKYQAAGAGVYGGYLQFITTSSAGSPTERMRIDSSGNVGIGTSSPSSKLEVAGAVKATGTGATASANAAVIDYVAGSTSRLISYGPNTTTPGAIQFVGLSSNSSAGDIRATIDTSGNLGLGVTPSAWSGFTAIEGTSSGNFGIAGKVPYVISNAYFNGSAWAYKTTAAASTYYQNVGNHYWNTAASGTAGTAITFTQAMTLDASGNLLVGKTASSATSVGFEVSGSAGNAYSTMASSTNAQSTWNVYSTGAAAYRFYVGMAGTVYATSTSIAAISDIRFKENVRDLDVGLDKIMALKPRLYDWKEGKGANIKNARGFIAQEFEQVFPDLIDEWKDPAPEGEEPYKSVRQDLIPVLVKAIQEQQALIDSLTTRLAALEAK